MNWKVLFVIALVAALCIGTTDARNLSKLSKVRAVDVSAVSVSMEKIAAINAFGAQLKKAAAETGASKCGTLKEWPAKTPNVLQLTGKMAALQPFLDLKQDLTLYLEAQAAAKAFIGISVGLGIGIDFQGTMSSAINIQRLYVCATGGIQLGHIGVAVGAGGALMLGFGSFATSLDKANLDFNMSVGCCGGAAGINVFLNSPVVDKLKDLPSCMLNATKADANGKQIIIDIFSAPNPPAAFVSFIEKAIKAKVAKCTPDMLKISLVGVGFNLSVSAGATAPCVAVDVTDAAVKTVQNLVNAVPKLKAALETGGEKLKELGGEAARAIGEAATNAAAAVKNGAGKAMGFLGKVGGAIGQAADKVAAKVTKAADKVAVQVTKAADKVAVKVTGKTKKF